MSKKDGPHYTMMTKKGGLWDHHLLDITSKLVHSGLSKSLNFSKLMLNL